MYTTDSRARSEQHIAEFADQCAFVRRFLVARNARLGAPFNVHDLEDLSQEVLLRAWTRLGEFRGDARLGSWLARFCELTLLDTLRRQRVRVTGPLIEDELSAAASDDVEERLDLRSLTLELPDLEASVVLARIESELPFAAIARSLALSRSAAHAAYHRGIARLRGIARDSSKSRALPRQDDAWSPLSRIFDLGDS